MEITTNKSNWSGESITIQFDEETKTWEQYGYTFRLEFVKFQDVDEDPELERLIGRGFWNVYSADDSNEYPIFKIDDKDAHAHHCGIDRSGESKGIRGVVEAAVKVLCNTL